ncbi:hypothetical protein EDC54_10861 [Samsonia erythrinae]|uniref:Uncharacterized protein n=1 Tax=Samsonia erythrinae TaxID=160434 RepID=A0A4R3VHA6_9GAMM|nr:hypothetical protein EDC54_10861 [Samsonia erythrinae]
MLNSMQAFNVIIEFFHWVTMLCKSNELVAYHLVFGVVFGGGKRRFCFYYFH